MSSGPIHVDQDALDAQVSLLGNLIADQTLKGYCGSSIEPLLTTSAGDAATKLRGLNQDLDDTVAQLYALMRATSAALSNVTIVEADAGLAQQIQDGTVGGR